MADDIGDAADNVAADEAAPPPSPLKADEGNDADASPSGADTAGAATPQNAVEMTEKKVADEGAAAAFAASSTKKSSATSNAPVGNDLVDTDKASNAEPIKEDAVVRKNLK